MGVFVGWSGPQSKQAAIALRRFLKALLQNSHPWMSEKDIAAGANWDQEIEQQLRKSTYGVICLTPDNLENRWLHYEAGAVAHQVGSAKVCPVLLSVSATELKQPLARFQNKTANESGIRELVAAINESLGDKRTDPETIADAFPALWPTLQEALDSINFDETATKPFRTEREILEEVLELTRAISAVQPALYFTTGPSYVGQGVTGGGPVAFVNPLMDRVVLTHDDFLKLYHHAFRPGTFPLAAEAPAENAESSQKPENGQSDKDEDKS